MPTYNCVFETKNVNAKQFSIHLLFLNFFFYTFVEPLSSNHDKAWKISTQDVADATGYKYEFSEAPVIRISS